MASYVYGNVVRRESPLAPKTGQEQKTVGQKVQSHRAKPVQMNRGYVTFLAIAAVVTLFSCVQYLQLQSEITNRSKNITSLQQELADAKEANTTKYNAIMNSMNLEEIRDIAMNEFGMVYASADQIVKYQDPTRNSIICYAGIPESGVVASADAVE